jgi:spore coat protein U-like protein
LNPADERQSARRRQQHDDTNDPDRSVTPMRSTPRFLLAAAVAAHAFAGVAAAQSSPQTANLSVTASVAANCTVSTSPVNFGSYNPLSAATVTATGQVLLRCTRGTIPAVALDNGGNAAGGQRRMANGGEFLAYNLMRPTGNDAGDACPAAGAGTSWSSAFTLTSAPSSAQRTFNVCGQLPGAQDVPAGTYTDTVVATVTF